ncbi:ENDOU, partial [Symbiodinium necroappetens]
ELQASIRDVKEEKKTTEAFSSQLEGRIRGIEEKAHESEKKLQEHAEKHLATSSAASNLKGRAEAMEKSQEDMKDRLNKADIAITDYRVLAAENKQNIAKLLEVVSSPDVLVNMESSILDVTKISQQNSKALATLTAQCHELSQQELEAQKNTEHLGEQLVLLGKRAGRMETVLGLDEMGKDDEDAKTGVVFKSGILLTEQQRCMVPRFFQDEYVRWRDCQCNRDCFKNQNCCYDYEQQCKGAKSADAPVLGALPKALAINKTTSLRGATTAKWGSCGEFTCAETYVSWRPCQCNSLCKDYGNCCSDYQAVCLSPPAPAIPGPAPQPPAVTPDLPDTSGPSAPIASVPVETTPPAPANVYAVNVTALPWTWKDGLNSPSESPLLTFYMYRAVSDEVYPPLNTNLGSLPGVLWYLHHEVVIQAPRKFQISRILRYKVQMRATAPLLRLGMHFGVRLAYDKGQATGPFVCGRTNVTNKDGTTEGYKPKFCGDGAFKAQYLPDLKPYKNEYEYSAYGYNVGCNKLGEYPFPMHPVYYPNAIWYTLPGACPNNLYYNKDNSCQASQPGGYCPNMEPNGNGTCTWNYEDAGEISLDELVGIKDYASWMHSHREYDPETDEGVKFGWWNGINSTTANQERVRQAAELFDRRYPYMPTVAELTNPPCDFNFGYFYKEWYRKDGYSGPCGPPNAHCKGGIWWIRHEGLRLHPKWYVPLTTSASDDDIQRLLYQLGENECLRPCNWGETPTAATPSKETP